MAFRVQGVGRRAGWRAGMYSFLWDGNASLSSLEEPLILAKGFGSGSVALGIQNLEVRLLQYAEAWTSGRTGETVAVRTLWGRYCRNLPAEHLVAEFLGPPKVNGSLMVDFSPKGIYVCIYIDMLCAYIYIYTHACTHPKKLKATGSAAKNLCYMTPVLEASSGSPWPHVTWHLSTSVWQTGPPYPKGPKCYNIGYVRFLFWES